MWNNQIETLAFVSELTRLEWLKIGANRLTSIYELLLLPQLKKVSLDDNLIGLKEGSQADQVLKELLDIGVAVNAEPQQIFNYFKKASTNQK